MVILCVVVGPVVDLVVGRVVILCVVVDLVVVVVGLLDVVVAGCLAGVDDCAPVASKEEIIKDRIIYDLRIYERIN